MLNTSVMEKLQNEPVLTILTNQEYHQNIYNCYKPDWKTYKTLHVEIKYILACLTTVPKIMWFILLTTKEEICQNRTWRSFLIWGRPILFIESSVFLYWHKNYCWTWRYSKCIMVQGTESRLNFLQILMRRAFMRQTAIWNFLSAGIHTVWFPSLSIPHMWLSLLWCYI